MKTKNDSNMCKRLRFGVEIATDGYMCVCVCELAGA